MYDGTILVYDAVEDKIYVWSPKSILEPDANGICYGLVYVYATGNNFTGVNKNNLPQLGYERKERYLVDPLYYDADSDSRFDGSIINDTNEGEPANWFDDPDDDGLVNAHDYDSDNDAIPDGLEDGEEDDNYNVTPWDSPSSEPDAGERWCGPTCISMTAAWAGAEQFRMRKKCNTSSF